VSIFLIQQPNAKTTFNLKSSIENVSAQQSHLQESGLKVKRILCLVPDINFFYILLPKTL